MVTELKCLCCIRSMVLQCCRSCSCLVVVPKMSALLVSSAPWFCVFIFHTWVSFKCQLILISPPGCVKCSQRWAYKMLLFLIHFQRFCQASYLTDLSPICSDDRTVAVDERSGLKLVFRSLKGRCHGNQFCGQNRPPMHTFDLRSRAFGEKCNCCILFGEANKLRDLIYTGEPFNGTINNN